MKEDKKKIRGGGKGEALGKRVKGIPFRNGERLKGHT